jgi:hypothetical protein
MPGPNLESLEHGSHEVSDDDNLINRVYNVIYKSTSQAFEKYQKALGRYKAHRDSELPVRCKTDSQLSMSSKTVINVNGS